MLVLACSFSHTRPMLVLSRSVSHLLPSSHSPVLALSHSVSHLLNLVLVVVAITFVTFIVVLVFCLASSGLESASQVEVEPAQVEVEPASTIGTPSKNFALMGNTHQYKHA